MREAVFVEDFRFLLVFFGMILTRREGEAGARECTKPENARKAMVTFK